MIHSLSRLTLLVLLTLCSWMGAQQLYAIGEWQIYNGTTSFRQGEIFDGRIYVIAGSSLCSFDAEEGYQEYNRTLGLSSSSVSLIRASRDGQHLCITYANGNIDLLDTEGNIWNIPDLFSKSLNESKETRSILEGEDGMFFLSGEYGFLQIDPSRHMVLQSIQNRKNIDFAFCYGNRLYRSSRSGGLEFCPLDANAADITQWHRISAPSSAWPVADMALYESHGSLRSWFTGADGHIYDLSSQGQVSQVGGIGQCRTLHPLHDLVLVHGNGFLALSDPASQSFSVSYTQPYVSCSGFFSHSDSAFYALHDFYGVLPCQFSAYEPNVSLEITADLNDSYLSEGIGTYFLGSLQLSPEHEVVGIARRSAISGYNAATSLGGCLSRFDPSQQQWYNVPIQDIVSRLDYRPSFNGLTSLAIDPTHPDRYAIGSWLFGLYVVDHDTLLCRYDELNTHGGVEAFDPSFSSTRVTAVAYDEEGNLFFANSMQDTTLRCLTSDGRFIKYPNTGFSQVSDASTILLARHDQVGLKWVLNDYGYKKSSVGLYYGEPGQGGTDGYQTAWFNRLIDQDNNEYLPFYIYNLCEDLTGKVWVLTNFGPFVIEDPVACFNYAQQNPGLGKVRRVKIPRNDGTNLADYLMESTNCTCMAIDNFNRKWIGTNGAGLYLLSADCITEIEHFSTANSPLLADDILSLLYDPDSGLLYISCEGGVLTYQTDAIEGESDYSSIYCYPNPVRPEYSGELRIMGLMNDSQVSITTTSGELVFRTHSQGSTATWDLHTADGSRAAPGIYLIHGVDAEGTKGGICKFLVL